MGAKNIAVISPSSGGSEGRVFEQGVVRTCLSSFLNEVVVHFAYGRRALSKARPMHRPQAVT